MNPKNSLLTLVLLTISMGSANLKLEANWINDHSISTVKPAEPEQTGKKDSIPAGVTKDWLNSLTDENGNRIIPEDEGDAFQRIVFNGPAVNSQFGAFVNPAGDVNGDGYPDLIIGAYGYSSGTGRAYIYFGGAPMDNVADVTMTGEAANNYFGNSVSTAGDVNGDGFSDVIVGAFGYSSSTGRAYIFYGGSSMNNVPDVIMTGAAVNQDFGNDVSTAGDVNGDGYSDVIAGSYGVSGAKGKADIFYGGAAMNNVPDVTMIGEAAGDFFGYIVSTAGDVNGDGFSDVIVGGPGAGSSFGKAYIYFGGATMDNAADIIMTGEAANSDFGTPVASAGDVNGDGYSDVIVGAQSYSSVTGRAYIFYGGASMNNTADVIMTGEAANNHFGRAVSSAGDINGDGYPDIIVGAYTYSSGTGRAYIYFGGSSMNNVADITITGETTSSLLGLAVASVGDMNGDGYSEVIVGASGFNSNTGRAYLYDYTMQNNISQDITMTGGAINDRFGTSVSSAGDVNGDGYSDIIVGAYTYSSNTGRAYIYFGGNTMDNVPDVVMTGSAGEYFGVSVSTAGDVNADGYSDVIVGAYFASSQTGKAYIFLGGASMNNIADVTLTGEATFNYFGYSVSTAGDVNADGYSDVIVGAYGYSSFIGRAYIFFGGAPMNNTADVTMTGAGTNFDFGRSVSSAGDVNGDGYSDVIVGAPDYSSSAGRAYIYFGGTSMNNFEDVTMTGEASYNSFGNSVSTAGDVNNDGYSDVIVGAPNYSTSIGRAYIFFGGAAMNNTSDVTLTGSIGAYLFGYSVSSAGDVNGDGFSDVIAGENNYSSGTGRAFVFFGGVSMDNAFDVTMTGDSIGSNFGYSVSSAQDINGDGYSDMIVGSYGYKSNTGRAYIFTGSAIAPIITLNILMFIQGFYNSASNTQVSDTVRAYLRDASSPYALVDSAKSLVNAGGAGTLRFRNAASGTYYIILKHRNSLETWSKAGGQSLAKGTTSGYFFSTSASQAYGSNMTQVDLTPVRFAIYSGDVNQDGFIDLADISMVYNGITNFVTGHTVTDVTGDNYTDLADLTLVYNSSSNFVKKVTP